MCSCTWAEALRVELVHLGYGREAPPGAIDDYLRARHHMVRDDFNAPEIALELLERCIEAAIDRIWPSSAGIHSDIGIVAPAMPQSKNVTTASPKRRL